MIAEKHRMTVPEDINGVNSITENLSISSFQHNVAHISSEG